MTTRLSSIANDVLFEKRLYDILIEFINTPTPLNEEGEEESEDLNPAEEKAMEKIMNVFASEIKKSKTAIEKAAEDPKEIEKILNQNPELKPLEKAVKEAISKSKNGKLNEAVGFMIAGLIAALPKLIELLGKFVSKAGSLLGSFGFKKGEDKLKAWANKLTHAGHGLHKIYLKILKGALYVVPGFNQFPDLVQDKIVEVVYIAIVGYLGFMAGAGMIDALEKASWITFGVEGLLGAIKAGEIGQWVASTVASLPGVLQVAAAAAA